MSDLTEVLNWSFWTSYTGYAVDIHVSNSQHRKTLIDYFATKVTGLGVAKTFLHIDLLTPELGFEMRPNAWKY